MKRGIILAIAGVGIVGLGVFGYGFAMQKAESLVTRAVASIERKLPAGSELAYESVAINPLTQSVTLTNIEGFIPETVGEFSVSQITASGLGFNPNAPTADLITFGSGTSTPPQGGKMTWESGTLSDLDASAFAETPPKSALDALQLVSIGGYGFDNIEIVIPDIAALEESGAFPEQLQSRLKNRGPTEIPVIFETASIARMEGGAMRDGILEYSTIQDMTMAAEGSGMTVGEYRIDQIDVRQAYALQDMLKTVPNDPLPVIEGAFRMFHSLQIRDFHVQNDDQTATLGGVTFVTGVENNSDHPLDSMMIEIGRLSVPVSEIPDLPADYAARFPDGQLTINLRWAHKLDRSTGVFDIGPVGISVPAMGDFVLSGRLDDVDPGGVPLEILPDKLFETAKLAGLSLRYQDAGLVRDIAPDILAAENMSLETLAQLAEVQGMVFLGEMVGIELAERTTQALAAFLRDPNTLALSVQSPTPQTLNSMMLMASLVPKQLAQKLDIEIEVNTPKIDNPIALQTVN